MAMRVFRCLSHRFPQQMLSSKSTRVLLQQQFLLGSSSTAPLLHWSSSVVKFVSNANVNGSGNASLQLDISKDIPKFDTGQADPKQEKKKKKKRSKGTNKRLLGMDKTKKKKKPNFPSPEARIKYKIEKAKIKETLLIEQLKKYEISKDPAPSINSEGLTANERFYLKRMGQKYKNYVPVGRRGVFGGVILNMHLHWKKHETVKVVCKHCKPGQIRQYAEEISRLSGGIAIHIQGKDTIIFYRGKNYVQPKVMTPKDTLSKRKALMKSKFEQSLESVRRFIAISEKELEIYYRHIALYSKPAKDDGDKQKLSSSDQEAANFDHGLENESSGESICSVSTLSDPVEGTEELGRLTVDPQSDTGSVTKMENSNCNMFDTSSTSDPLQTEEACLEKF